MPVVAERVVVTAGERKYELVRDWGRLPAGWRWGEVSAVAVDSKDNVHVFTRTDHPYMVFDPSGKLVDSWGDGIFEDAHGICILPDDTVYFIDRGPQVVLKFDKSGRHRLTLGKRHQPADTGWIGETKTVTRAGPPFHHPTDASIGPGGEIYVSDGYRNSCVHKFAPDGTLLRSWGEPGNPKELKNTREKPGHFHTVHSVLVHQGKVYVADRENDRIQIFSPDGEYLDMWTDFRRPAKLHVGRDGLLYVAELDSRVSIVDLTGAVVGRFGNDRSLEPGKLGAPHGLATDSRGDIYVGEVQEVARLQKFARVA